MATNLQGLTPEEMGAKAQKAMEDRVKAQSVANPGELQAGGQATNDVMGDSRFFQAYTNPIKPVNPADSLPEPESKGVLTSDMADAWTTEKTDALTKEQNLLEMNLAQGNMVSPGVSPKNTEAKVGGFSFSLLDPNTGQIDPELQALAARGGSENDVRSQWAKITTRKQLESRYAPERKQFETSQKNAEATGKAATFKMGQAGSTYGNARIAEVKNKLDLQRQIFNRDWADLVNGAQNAIQSGFWQEVDKIQQRLAELPAERDKQEQDYYDRLEQMQDIQNKMIEADTKLIQQGKDLRESASEVIGDYAKSGQVFTADHAEMIASQYGIDPQDALNIYDVAKSEYAVSQGQEFEDLVKARQDNMMKYLEAADKIGIAVPVQFAGSEYIYQGMDTSGLKTGIETDDSGFATYWQVDPRTKEINTVGMGYLGPTKGWQIKEGRTGLWRVNENTGQMQRLSPSNAQKTLSFNGIEEGSLSPFDPTRGQCGEFVNDATGVGVGDTYESKMARTNPEIKAGSDNPPKYGDFFVQKLGTWTGHTGIVLDYYEEDGQQFVNVIESNYHKDGKIGYRTIPVDEIDGYGRPGNIAEVLKIGSDSPMDFSTEFGTIYDKKAEEETKPLSASDIQAFTKLGYDVKPGDTLSDISSQSVEKKEDPMTVYLGEQSDLLIKNIDEALNMISGKTTGVIGKISAWIPGTRSYELARALEAVGSNIGFEQLSSMRAASPTGGALGQVSERELTYLQSTKGSIDQFQSQERLKKTLIEIKSAAQRLQGDVATGEIKTKQVQSPDGKQVIEYDLSNPAQASEYQEALDAGWISE